MMAGGSGRILGGRAVACLAWIFCASLGTRAADGLNPRVGPRVIPGVDPMELTADRRAQAESHIARNPRNPDDLLATFQEGRFTDGGALSCGYAHSTDGGLSWSRSLLPQLTRISGGNFDRATDPVAAFDGFGNAFLCTLGLSGANTELGVLLLHRSSDGGATFAAPVEVYRPPTSAIFPDKGWLAVNPRTNGAYAGRLAVTFTRFEGTVNPLAITLSDDQGSTWTEPSIFTPARGSCQGSQPVWLPDGNLLVVYWNFGDAQSGTGDRIECVRSVDGGRTFGPVTPVNARVRIYDAPSVRDGAFLPSAAVATESGAILVAYQALDADGLPRVLVQRSLDAGVAWSAPVAVSDNVRRDAAGVIPDNWVSTGDSFNPAIAVSPDGRRVVVVFFDSRIQQLPWVDTFAAESMDGGLTWGANLRLTDHSTDVRLAPRTGSGYMLGDYLGVVAPVDADTPAVVMTMVENQGGIDPLAVRWGVGSGLTFETWRAARWSHEAIHDPAVATADSDADGDGFSLRSEYVFGLDPGKSEPAAAAGLHWERSPSGALVAGLALRVGMTDFSYRLEHQVEDAFGWLPWSAPDETAGADGRLNLRWPVAPTNAVEMFRFRGEIMP